MYRGRVWFYISERDGLPQDSDAVGVYMDW